MDELIKIDKQEFREVLTDTVNARELHSFLESKQQFSNWILNRIGQFDFVEGVDFIQLNKYIYSNSKPRIEYFLSIDTAKELSMVENNSKGSQARKYFIGCEKKLKEISVANPIALPDFNNPVEAARAWADAKESELKVKIELKEAKPKIEFHDELIESDGLYSMGEAAKLLGTGRTRLFIKLRELKIFFNTEPYQKYKDQGYFAVKTTTKNSHVQVQSFVTPKGLEWLNKKLKSDGNFQTSF